MYGDHDLHDSCTVVAKIGLAGLPRWRLHSGACGWRRGAQGGCRFVDQRPVARWSWYLGKTTFLSSVLFIVVALLVTGCSLLGTRRCRRFLKFKTWCFPFEGFYWSEVWNADWSYLYRKTCWTLHSDWLSCIAFGARQLLHTIDWCAFAFCIIHRRVYGGCRVGRGFPGGVVSNKKPHANT